MPVPSVEPELPDPAKVVTKGSCVSRPDDDRLIPYPLCPSAVLSSTPVTVTAWLVCQLFGVKVRVAGETVPSAVLLLATLTVTFKSSSRLYMAKSVASVPLKLIFRIL